MDSLISVIIATRNREALLAQTLEALAGQDWPRSRFEILVADNGSTDGTRGVVDRAAAQPTAPRIRYLYVAAPGKSPAVNTALLFARGELLAFTDDDVLPDPTWLRQLAGAFTDTTDFVAGRVRPRWETEPPPWLSPALYGVLAIPDNGDAPLAIRAGEHEEIIPIGANMAVRAAVLRRLGGLRPDLGKLDGTLRTGEDHELFLRMLRAGCRGVYEPTAVVQHWVPQERLERSYFRRWLYQNGRDVARLEVPYTTVRSFLGVPRYLWRVAAIDAATTVSAVLANDDRQRVAAFLRILWFCGYLRESWTRPPRLRSNPVRLAEGR